MRKTRESRHIVSQTHTVQEQNIYGTSPPRGSACFRSLAAPMCHSVLTAFSSRIVGGVGTDGTGNREKTRRGPSPIEAASTPRRGKGDENGPREEGRPNVVIVVLESTSGTLVEASDAAGVSPWAKELASR